MTFTSDQYVAIVGTVFGIAGFVVGAIGIYYAVKLDRKATNLDRKLKTAQEAEKQIETKFMQNMAAQEFTELAKEVVEVMEHIRNRNWAVLAGLTSSIGPSLGQVRGARTRLLDSLEKDRLDAAAGNVQKFIDSLPLAGKEADLVEPQLQAMLLWCRPLVDIASEIAGRLRVESMQQSGDEK